MLLVACWYIGYRTNNPSKNAEVVPIPPEYNMLSEHAGTSGIFASYSREYILSAKTDSY
jgi:hypothetical protein